jgi:hypothetical protein
LQNVINYVSGYAPRDNVICSLLNLRDHLLLFTKDVLRGLITLAPISLRNAGGAHLANQLVVMIGGRRRHSFIDRMT